MPIIPIPAREDIELWLPKVHARSYLAGHDYSYSFFDVIQAVKALFGVYNVCYSW